MLTTVDGEVGTIFSAADVINAFISNMGNCDGDPLVDVDGIE